MQLKRLYALILILVTSLLLSGSDRFGCTDDSSGGSSGGSTGTRVRVSDEQKISSNNGNFNGNLNDGDRFGSAVTDTGDLEADGVRDLAVGAPFDDDDGSDKGAIWMLFMDSNGLVDGEQKISSDAGGFQGDLDSNDLFGSALAGIGDLNGDGTFDLATGAPGGDSTRGEIWILFLNDAGRVRQEQKIADGTGGFDGDLDTDDRFGSAIADIGDLNGDGIRDLVVGAPNDDDDSDNAGAIWILLMRENGLVGRWQKISSDEGGFNGDLDADDNFGAAVAGTGDLDNDGIPDLAVGAPGSNSGRGDVWILFLDALGRVREEQRMTDSVGGFDGNLDKGDRFGSAVADIRDLNGDGFRDLAVGAPNDDDGSDNAGAVWILLMQSDGRVDGWQKISKDEGGFNGDLDADDHFGAAISGTGDLDNDGVPDLAAGSPGDDDGGTDQGAIWILFMDL